MNQKNPLFSYRTACPDNIPVTEQEVARHYDSRTGLWYEAGGVPVIEKFVNSRVRDKRAETHTTDSREGIDRGETSSPPPRYLNDTRRTQAGPDETLITETRESIDRSEGSVHYEDFVALKGPDETLITKTREGIDTSESSSFVPFVAEEYKIKASGSAETLITRSREGIDTTERSNEIHDYMFQTIQTFTRESTDRNEEQSE